jgi:hypothetical protein
MKIVLILTLLISTTLHASGEEPWSSGTVQQKYPGQVSKNYKPKSAAASFPRWAVHSNLLGFVQFGPVVSIEHSFTRNLTLNVHGRFSPVGALTPILYQADVDRGGRPDQFSGIAFGGGPMWFFNTKKDRVYAGIMFEYEMSDALYMEGYVNEWSSDNRKIIMMLNSGYRFRFGQKMIAGSGRKFGQFIREGLFVNTGVYLGAERNNYSWDYTEPGAGEDDLTPREGTEIRPFGMVEVSLGMEF